MIEIIEMVQTLQRMGTDTYLQCKYTLQAVSRDQQREKDFINKLFSVADSRRPLLIEMKEEASYI